MHVFHDRDGNEGLNALVRIDDVREPAQAQYVWVDRIRSIRRHGSA